MATETYVQTKEKTLAPLNIIPSDLIKCTHCNMYIPHRQLQAHSELHIPTALKESPFNKNNSHVKKKIELKNILFDQNFEEEIQVQSFLPEEMPERQLERKQALLLSKGTQKFNANHIEVIQKTSENNQAKRCKFKKPEQLLLSSQFPTFSFTPQIQSNLSFKKQIKIAKQQRQLKLKCLNYYTNKKPNEDGVYQNKVVIPAKQNEQKQDVDIDQNSLSYAVEPVKRIKNTSSPMRIELNSTMKLVKHKQRISTASTGQGFYMQSQSNWNQNQSNSRELEAANVVNEFECAECKGFYCKTCKSDIPPMFRPPIIKMEGELLGIPKNWKQFRQLSSSYNKQGGQTSRMTRCTNCQ